MGGKRVTIKDVAAAAGVSPMTVSNVINGRGRPVKDQTRRRVERAIARLNYRVVSSGRNLRLGRRQAVAVVIVDHAPDFLANPFIAALVAGISRVLYERGYTMVVQGLHPDEFRSAIVMNRAEADAYCVKLAGSAAERRAMRVGLGALEEPVALIQEHPGDPDLDLCTVRQDDRTGGLMLADHLLARGARRIAVLTPRYSGSMIEQRVRGLHDGVQGARARSVRLDAVVAPVNSFASAFAAAGTYLDGGARPDAIFAGNDQLAIAALRALQERRMRVPQDVLVTGFNGFEPPEFTQPSLTTVVSAAGEIGAAAGRALLDRLATGRFAARDLLLPVTLRKGGST